MERSYVRITNATRQYMWSDSALCKATIETTKYRHGEIGLLHPGIVKFYEDLEKNMKEESIGKLDYLSKNIHMVSPGIKRWHRGEQQPCYTHDKRNIPILMYEELPIHFEERRNKDHNYFIATLRQGEFELVQNPEIDTRHFEAFDILMKGRTFDIPVEIAEFGIPVEHAKSLEETLRNFRDADLARARDQIGWTYPIGT